MLPLVLVLLLAVVQVAVVARAHVLVGAAARDAARAAAVGDSDGSARAAAIDGSGLDPSRTQVRIETTADSVTAHVTYRDNTDVPLVGRVTGDVTVHASVTMRRER